MKNATVHAMFLRDFLEIHRRAVRRKPSALDVVSLLILTAGLIQAITGYWHGFDSVLDWFLHKVIPDPSLFSSKSGTLEQVLREAHQKFGALPRIFTAISVFVVYYIAVFSYHALKLAGMRSKEIDGLKEANASLLANSDYQEKLVAALGIRFRRESLVYEVTDLQGACTLQQEVVFEVLGLELHHMVRVQASTTPNAVRGKPTFSVEPSRYKPSRSFHEDAGGTRLFHVYFAPALVGIKEPITLRVEEELKSYFYLYKEAIPDADSDGSWGLEGKREFVAQMVTQPVDVLELTIRFPGEYSVIDPRFFLVRYGRTRTVHNLEEDRLTKENAVTVQNLTGGKREIKLTVKKPVAGLAYYLCWEPPTKKQYDALLGPQANAPAPGAKP